MARAAADWLYGDLHEKAPFHDGTFKEWSAKRTQATPYHFRDGVHIWVSREDLTPGDDFLAQKPNETEGGD